MNNLKQKLLDLNIFEDNEYLDKYVELIESNRETKKERFKTDKHHIIPRCYFHLNKIKIDNSKENLVNLLYKDHVLAHYYLVLCSSNDYIKYSNQFAFLSMIQKHKMVTDISDVDLNLYASIRENFCKQRSNQMLGYKWRPESIQKRNITRAKTYKVSEETKEKQRIGNLGKKHIISPDSRRRMSEAKKGKPSPRKGVTLSKETREKLSKSLKGRDSWRKGLTKEINPKLIQSEETITKIRNKLLGSSIMTNGTINKRVFKNEIPYYLSIGWVKGITKIKQK